MHGETFHVDLFVMPLAGFDLVLGTQWLGTLGPIVLDVAARTMQFQRTGRAVGQAIASATALLDLELVAIGGGFSQATPDLFDVINGTIAEHYFEFVRKVRVVPSGLSGEGPLVGAAALVHRSELLPPL